MTNNNLKPTQNQRNASFDFIKGLACILVVFNHCTFPSKFGTTVIVVSRFVVPFFFMVSGYFARPLDTGKFDPWKKTKHIGGITLWASLFYLFFAVVTHCISGTPIAFAPKELLNLLLFNMTPDILPVHLWFLFALLYVILLFALIARFNLYKFAYWMIPVLLISYIILAQGMYLCGIDIHRMYYRNFLFYGFPFFMLGDWLRHNKSLNLKVNNNLFWIIIAVSSVLCRVECFALKKVFSFSISTIPQVICLFILCMNNNLNVEHSLLSYIGLKLSLYVYVFHMFIMNLADQYMFSHIIENKGCTVLMYLRPIIVVILTLIFSFLFSICKDWIRHKSHQHSYSENTPQNSAH